MARRMPSQAAPKLEFAAPGPDNRLHMKKLYVKTYGCQMNAYDSARIADLLQLTPGQWRRPETRRLEQESMP